VESEFIELEGLMRVLWAEYAELVGLFYMAQFSRDPQIREQFKTDRERAGFEVIRAALFRSLLLALAKIIFDDDRRSHNPSVKRLYRQFSGEKAKGNSTLLAFLEKRFVKRLNGRPEGTCERFNAHLDDIFAHWTNLANSPSWQGLKTLRNKVIAHSDLEFCAGEWRLINPNEINLSIDDFDKIRTGVEDFINAFNLAISAMRLNFEEIHEKAKSAAHAFWRRLV
jgi:hypothetical protein